MHDKYEVILSFGSKVMSNVKAFQDTQTAMPKTTWLYMKMLLKSIQES